MKLQFLWEGRTPPTVHRQGAYAKTLNFLSIKIYVVFVLKEQMSFYCYFLEYLIFIFLKIKYTYSKQKHNLRILNARLIATYRIQHRLFTVSVCFKFFNRWTFITQYYFIYIQFRFSVYGRHLQRAGERGRVNLTEGATEHRGEVGGGRRRMRQSSDLSRRADIGLNANFSFFCELFLEPLHDWLNQVRINEPLHDWLNQVRNRLSWPACYIGLTTAIKPINSACDSITFHSYAIFSLSCGFLSLVVGPRGKLIPSVYRAIKQTLPL